jgi:collagen type VII alpha
MPASLGRLRFAVFGASVFALAALAAGGTLAASTNPPTLYACFNASGQVAMATVPQCKLAGGGQLAYWGTQGVPGPTGASGATGPTGATGAVGPAGAGSATTIVDVPADNSQHAVWTGPGYSVTLTCGGAGATMWAMSPAGSQSVVVVSFISSFTGSISSGGASAGPGGGAGGSFDTWIDLSATDGTTSVHFIAHRTQIGAPAGMCRFYVTG